MTGDRNIIEINAGSLTEDLISYVTGELEDDVLDEVEVGRELDRPDHYASEPITIAAILIGTTAAIVQIGRLLERWTEMSRQKSQVNLVIKAYTVSPEAGKAVENVVAKHAEVVTS
ncbi:hypothetical protein VX037_20225, partial [Gordonia sp. Z-3]|uniref:hypothetical protein n=1 Tax=Gordonia sp. Z-3 TaxID=3115408 RepID=UPI002E2DC91B